MKEILNDRNRNEQHYLQNEYSPGQWLYPKTTKNAETTSVLCLCGQSYTELFIKRC